MFVQLICKNREEKQMEELYEVLGALCEREGVQIEERGGHVEILVCPQGKIVAREDGKDLILSSNTRHGGPGFHAFVVDLFKDIEEEIPGDYELDDDLDYARDENFDRLVQQYEQEIDYVRQLVLEEPGFKDRNYMFDETYYLPKAEAGQILTASGDMDEHEFRAKDAAELMDHFYVWNNWDRDGRFFRNAALTLLAKESYGEFSKMNEQTEKVANEICDDLEIAFRLDPTLGLPIDAYKKLISVLGRDNKLEGAIEMDGEAVSYRTREVYHIFEDVRIVAAGTAERSYDPATQSIFLTSPFKEEQEWAWLLQASKQPSILPDLKSVQEQEPEFRKDDSVLWLEEYKQDGIYTIDAMIRDNMRDLYIHGVARSEAERDYLKTCIEESGFTTL